jgi:prepilin peptidase CpaA
MTLPAVPIQGALAALVLAAAAYDVRFRRIPNWLALAGVLAGFTLNGVLAGLAGVKLAAAGFGVAFAGYFLLYLIRAMGAGDVKLMGAVGSLVGSGNWFMIFVLTAILGGVAALALVIVKGRLRKTLWNVAYLIGELARFRAPYLRREELDVKSGSAVTLPHGVAIAGGTLIYLLMLRLS